MVYQTIIQSFNYVAINTLTVTTINILELLLK